MIGVNNIFTVILFWIMLVSGVTLSSLFISEQLFTGNLIFIGKFFIGIVILITIGVSAYFLFKFRLLYIAKKKLIIVNPFILRFKFFELDSIIKSKWTSWDIKATVFRTIEIKFRNGEKIKLSDFEFENLDIITSKLLGVSNSIEKSQIDYLQAKTNLSFISYVIIFNLLLIGFVTYLNIYRNEFHWTSLIIYLISLTLVFASYRRRTKYLLITKNMK